MPASVCTSPRTVPISLRKVMAGLSTKTRKQIRDEFVEAMIARFGDPHRVHRRGEEETSLEISRSNKGDVFAGIQAVIEAEEDSGYQEDAKRVLAMGAGQIRPLPSR